MEASELRIGNLINSREGYIKITPLNIVEQYQCDIANKEYFKPILLADKWLYRCNVKIRAVYGSTTLVRMVDNIGIPDYIEFVHELQNWYYWHFNKTELTIKE